MNLLPLAHDGGTAAAMAWWACGLWGLAGGLGIEAWKFHSAMRRGRRPPWRLQGEPGFWPFTLSVVIRGALGGGLAIAAGQTGQIGGPVGAIAFGVAAPFLVEQLKNVRAGRTDDIYQPMPERLLTRPSTPRAARLATKKNSTGSRDAG